MHLDLTHSLLGAALLLRKERWESRWRSVSAPAIASTCLGAAIIAQITLAAISLRPSPRAAAVHLAARSAPSTHRLGADVTAIVGAHLFGTMGAPDIQATDAPATRQGLILSATFAKADPGTGLAIIADGTQPAQLYSAGAAIVGGAVLEKVFFDRVILRRNGDLETLAMRAKNAGNQDPIKIVTAAQQSPSTPQLPAISQPTQSSETSSTSVRMNNLVLMPVFGDRSAGARIGNLKVLPAFTRAGLKSGDIITAINGEPIHAVGKAATLLQAAAGGSLTITIKRGTGSQDVQVESLD